MQADERWSGTQNYLKYNSKKMYYIYTYIQHAIWTEKLTLELSAHCKISYPICVTFNVKSQIFSLLFAMGFLYLFLFLLLYLIYVIFQHFQRSTLNSRNISAALKKSHCTLDSVETLTVRIGRTQKVLYNVYYECVFSINNCCCIYCYCYCYCCRCN